MKNAISISCLAFSLMLLLSYCSKKPLEQQSTDVNFSTEQYKAEWKTIDSLNKKRLPRSALKEVEALLKKIEKTRNPGQYVKALIHRSQYQTQIEEYGLSMAIHRFEEATNKAQQPEKAMLQSMLGQLYNQYLMQNSYKLKNRSTTSGFVPEDIKTWSAERLIRESNRLYRASASWQGAKDVALETFKPIIVNEYEKKIWTNLHDFLNHRALKRFNNQQSNLLQPANKFYLNDERAFLPAEQFVNAKFDHPDTISARLNTLLHYQEILRNQIAQKNTEALILFDLQRLSYVQYAWTGDNARGRAIKAYTTLLDKHESNPISTQIAYQMAGVLNRRTDDQRTDGTRWDKRDARQLLEKVLAKFPDAYASGPCKNLLLEINRISLHIRSESAYAINKDALVNVNYTNVSKAYYRVVEVDFDFVNKLNQQRQSKIVNEILQREVVQEGAWSLADSEDHHKHNTEQAIEPMPSGMYMIVVGTDSKFSIKNQEVSYATFHISNLSHFYRQRENGLDVYVVDRLSGQPQVGVECIFYEAKYNRRSRRSELIEVGRKNTDANGLAAINSNSETRSLLVTMRKGNDFLDGRQAMYFYRRYRNFQPYTSAHFFMDRAIYRPGQIIYFKGLAIETKGDDVPTIKSNEKVTVTFFDPNNQRVSFISVRTNEYGTFSGSFTAPSGASLTGGHFLEAKFSNGQSRVRFKVEEYKRPKFKSEVNKPDQGYRLDEMVTVKGSAATYAGTNVDNAKVKYRVTRMARYPYLPWYYSRYYPQKPAMEIANGVVHTDAKGNFTFDFKAANDPSVDAETNPIFDFKVHVDVTDITGETRSSSQVYRIGHVGLNLSLDLAGKLDLQKEAAVKINSENMNGEFEPASGKIVISQIAPHRTQFRKRYWGKPDVWSLTQATYSSKFPNYAYKGEDELKNREVQGVVQSVGFDTDAKKEFEVDVTALKPGMYEFKAEANDRYGKSVVWSKVVTVYNSSSNAVPTKNGLWHTSSKSKAEPGESVELAFGGPGSNPYVLFEQEHKKRSFGAKWLRPNALAKESIRIEEKHRGNVGYKAVAVFDNRVYSKMQNIIVPWSNKELQLEYRTFRDKLYPGQDERWEIVVKGPKGEKVGAEMVAAMYDASLDAFSPYNYKFNVMPKYNQQHRFTPVLFNLQSGRRIADWSNSYEDHQPYQDPVLNWFGFNVYQTRWLEGIASTAAGVRGGKRFKNVGAPMPSAPPPGNIEMVQDSEESGDMVAANGMVRAGRADGDETDAVTDSPMDNLENVSVRTNLKETVFFFPDLKTDAEGNIILSFKMNEALTAWKFLAFAHTKELQSVLTEKEVVTQKDLMVMPNAPRFFRDGDAIEYVAKVSNLSEKALSGSARLELLDALTMKPIDRAYGNGSSTKSFSVAQGESKVLRWKLKIPDNGTRAIVHRVVAKAGSFSDGEEAGIPVLTNRMLVTETMPLPVRGKEKKEFNFKSFVEHSASPTMEHHKYTLEYTSNPAWYAVKALPYLMEYPYDCTEQIFSRFYANSLASSAANSHPQVKRVFEQWRGTDALESQLEKNQELKSALLAETPWVMQAQSETEQRQRIGLLFDLNKMASEKAQALKKLEDRQGPDGAWSWFPGGRPSWYITQYIVEGLGHLDVLGVNDVRENWTMVEKAIGFIDAEIVRHYERQKRYSKDMSKDHLSNMAIHYIYARSFFNEVDMPERTKKVYDYYLGQGKKYWTNKGIYQEGMIGLALHRTKNSSTVEEITKSLKERALIHDELGRYWKMQNGWFWYEHPIETQALMIELFEETTDDLRFVEDLKVWLLKNKQTNHWKTTKATASAVYALLMNGASWLAESAPVKLKVGSKNIDQSEMDVEPGSGYFKMAWDGKDVTKDLAKVEVDNPNSTIAWGAVYWQYFEDLDAVKTFEETPLTLNKKVFKEKATDRGPVIEPVVNGSSLIPGDKIKVRIELRVDRDMEYVHMKDMRASGLEPLNVLSQYKWQGGLGYYESTRDVSTNFFFDRLPKGTYVFEYPLWVQHAGDLFD